MVDYSKNGVRLRRIAIGYRESLVSYFNAWSGGYGKTRRELLKEAVKGTWSDDLFEANVKLEVLAWYAKEHSESKAFVKALTDKLQNRHRLLKFKRKAWIFLSVVGLGVVLLSTSFLIGFLVVPGIGGAIGGSIGVSTGIPTALIKILGGIMLQIAFGVATVKIWKSGMAMYHAGWASMRRDPVRVVYPEERRRIVEALQEGAEVQILDHDGQSIEGSHAAEGTDEPLQGIEGVINE